jgi:transglutaminase-like putative cysteine protease
MLVTTLHETIFEYPQPIRATFTEARLWPVSDEGQTCREFSLTVDPMRPLTECIDYYGNRVLTFNILREHGRVVLTGHSVVETHRDPFAPREPLSDFEVRKAHCDYLSFDGPVENVPEIENLMQSTALRTAPRDASWWEPESVFAAAQNLSAQIYEQFIYDTKATDVHTHIAEVFARGAGVCQDFAHIFIAACRAAQVPARYVSGYLVTRRSRSAAGSPASHAWAEVLVPGLGWCAFDPTNNLVVDNNYIKLAVGRDYRDVPPTRGVYNGRGAGSRLHVWVHTIVDEESAAEVGETDEQSTALAGAR